MRKVSERPCLYGQRDGLGVGLGQSDVKWESRGCGVKDPKGLVRFVLSAVTGCMDPMRLVFKEV